jgi:hypothetical protein
VKFSSPKNQAQPVGLPVDASVKVTVNGNDPFTGVAVNCATGKAARTIGHNKRTRAIAMMRMDNIPNLYPLFV